ncbi:MAG: tRNA-binding protein [Chitinophagales bacterium]|nr:tRNA-binding protein [Chitinophagales bacterium]
MAKVLTSEKNTVGEDQFQLFDLRTGTITEAAPLPKARKPAYRLTVDFGPLGIKKSSAQITERYRAEELPGKQVIAVVNLPAKYIAGFRSECLVLGVLAEGGVVLLQPDQPVANGLRIG